VAEIMSGKPTDDAFAAAWSQACDLSAISERGA
jgi:hypothetical protein